MSTTKPTTNTTMFQAPLDTFWTGADSLPIACELCGNSDDIVISSDVATLCINCATSLSALRPSSIPTAIGALRAARRMHLASIPGRPSRRHESIFP